MKVMISQPMSGRSEETIKNERKEIIEKFNKMHIEVIDTLFAAESPQDCHTAIFYLAKAINAMSGVDALYMCDGWPQARGCRIEYLVAQEYGIKILDKKFFQN